MRFLRMWSPTVRSFSGYPSGSGFLAEITTFIKGNETMRSCTVSEHELGSVGTVDELYRAVRLVPNRDSATLASISPRYKPPAIS